MRKSSKEATSKCFQNRLSGTRVPRKQGSPPQMSASQKQGGSDSKQTGMVGSKAINYKIIDRPANRVPADCNRVVLARFHLR
jgi:hypothetical protein